MSSNLIAVVIRSVHLESHRFGRASGSGGQERGESISRQALGKWLWWLARLQPAIFSKSQSSRADTLMSTSHASFRLKQVETVGRTQPHDHDPQSPIPEVGIYQSFPSAVTELCRAPNNARSDYSQGLQGLLLAIVTSCTGHSYQTYSGGTATRRCALHGWSIPGMLYLTLFLVEIVSTYKALVCDFSIVPQVLTKFGYCDGVTKPPRNPSPRALPPHLPISSPAEFVYFVSRECSLL